MLYPVEAYYDTRSLTGLWSTQAKVEGNVLKSAWHWGSDGMSSTIPLRNLAANPLYVGLPSAWGSLDGDYMFSANFVGGLLFGDSNRYE